MHRRLEPFLSKCPDTARDPGAGKGMHMQSSKSTMSRRNFVGAAGGAVALGLAAGGMASAQTANTVLYSHADAIDWDAEFDVVVIGYGGAGSVAAITAHEAGARVLITDKAPLSDVGGNTRYCEQYMFMPDSYETGMAYYMAMSTGFDSMTPEIADFMSRGTQQIGDFVLSHGATTFSSYVEFALNAMGITTLDAFKGAENEEWYVLKPDGTVGMTEYPVWCDGTPDGGRTDISYMVDVPDGGEKKFWNIICFNNIEALNEEAEDFERWVDSPARHLVQDPFTKTVLGVQIEHEGKLLNVRALNGVVLACGSYEASQEMCETYAQYPVAYPHGSVYNTGDGINMGIEVGAQLWHMDALSGPWISPKLHGQERCFSLDHHSQRITAAYSCINVGGDAKRFMNESGACRHGHVCYGGTWQSQIVPDVVWAIFDDPARNSGGDVSVVLDEDMCIADSIEALAEMAGLDPKTLAATVSDYNALCAEGLDDPRFERPARYMAPIETAPFYACRLYPSCVNAQGGPKRNTNCEVLDTEDNPIPNLYSCGELGSFWAGPYPCGGNIAETVYTGRCAGANAALVKEPPAAVELRVMA